MLSTTIKRLSTTVVRLNLRAPPNNFRLLSSKSELATVFPGVDGSDSASYTSSHPKTLLSSILLKKQNLTGSKRYRNIELQILSTSISNLSKDLSKSDDKEEETTPYNNELLKFLPKYPILTRSEFTRRAGLKEDVQEDRLHVHVDLDAFNIIKNRIVEGKFKLSEEFDEEMKVTFAADKKLVLEKIHLLNLKQLEIVLKESKKIMDDCLFKKLESKGSEDIKERSLRKSTYRVTKWLKTKVQTEIKRKEQKLSILTPSTVKTPLTSKLSGEFIKSNIKSKKGLLKTCAEYIIPQSCLTGGMSDLRYGVRSLGKGGKKDKSVGYGFYRELIDGCVGGKGKGIGLMINGKTVMSVLTMFRTKEGEEGETKVMVKGEERSVSKLDVIEGLAMVVIGKGVLKNIENGGGRGLEGGERKCIKYLGGLLREEGGDEAGGKWGEILKDLEGVGGGKGWLSEELREWDGKEVVEEEVVEEEGGGEESGEGEEESK
ncbi:hypothetical protein TrLO_g11662 [Triparma laevis f. longispina]|uniref:Uncharacterized protein n=1 Tax=Triparma laevis f. longispina TaxID=1714387 RepID=A0A9W7CBC7_9STRA|nr:hypothetical protein TrLO_g11662 [Triparma laevis f. longispina]